MEDTVELEILVICPLSQHHPCICSKVRRSSGFDLFNHQLRSALVTQGLLAARNA